MLKFYIEKGAQVDFPPDKVSKLYIDQSSTSEYRSSPFIIQAACLGDIECFEVLVKHGCKITDHGFIGLSKKRRNQVISNIVGAAAYNNSTKILQAMLKKKSLADINHLAKEQQDFNLKGTFTPEYTGYTPLMLAVAGGGQNLESVKLLVASKANLTVVDPLGNSVLHIAVANDNADALQYLLSVWPENSLEAVLPSRNKNGETANSIAASKKNQEILNILDKCQQRIGDLSKQTTKDLLDDLLREEEKKEIEKAKRKDKKTRHKINHLAEKKGVTREEMQARLNEVNEAKRLEDEAKQREEEVQQRRAIDASAEEQRNRNDRIRQLENSDEDTPAPKDRKKVASKHVKFSEEQPAAAKQEAPKVAETQFAHVKVKKPEYQAPTVQKVVVEAKPVDKEEVKIQTQKEQANEPNRKQRKYDLYMKEQEYKKRHETPKPVAVEKKEEVSVEVKPKAKEIDEISEASEDVEVLGLSSELKMKTLGAKARQRLRRKLLVEQAEKEANKERIKKHFEAQEAEKLKKEQEEVERVKQEEEKKREEREEKRRRKLEKKANPIPPTTTTAGQPHYRQKKDAQQVETPVKEVVETKEAKPIKEKKEAPVAPQYRPKVKAEVLPTET